MDKNTKIESLIDIKALAERIQIRILYDIISRRGLKQQWHQFDAKTRKEITNNWKSQIEEEITQTLDKSVKIKEFNDYISTQSIFTKI